MDENAGSGETDVVVDPSYACERCLIRHPRSFARDRTAHEKGLQVIADLEYWLSRKPARLIGGPVATPLL